MAVSLLTAADASASWEQPVGGAKPVNQDVARNGDMPSAASFNGVPHVAWRENDGTNDEIRVARLNAAGTAWEQPWATATSGGINRSTSFGGLYPSLAVVGSDLWIAWVETDGTNAELRVSRLGPTGTWQEVTAGATATDGKINQSAGQNASAPSLADVGGVPYVAWQESDGTNAEIRVKRFNFGTNAWDAVGAGVTANYGGVNRSNIQAGSDPDLLSVAGVPHIAWWEQEAGGQDEVRVSRLVAGAWQEIAATASATSGGINQSTTMNAFLPDLAEAGGSVYVAWIEFAAASNRQIRVAKLTGTAWSQPWQGVSNDNGGITPATSNDLPSLASAGGVPYLSWSQEDGPSSDMRVARLAGDRWEQPWARVSATDGGINDVNGHVARQSSLIVNNGVPFLAFNETDGVPKDQIRVSRLVPEFSGLGATPTLTGATLTATARTFGLPYTIGFQHGPGFAASTPGQATAAGTETVPLSATLTGLAPATTFSYRPFAIGGVPAPTALGPSATFTTLSPPDKTAPTLKLAGSLKQVLGKTVSLKARCTDEPCVVTVTGTLTTKAPRRPARTARAFSTVKLIRTLSQNKVRTLAVKLSLRSRRSASSIFARKGTVKVGLRIVARDKAGNKTKTRTRTITLRKPKPKPKPKPKR